MHCAVLIIWISKTLPDGFHIGLQVLLAALLEVLYTAVIVSLMSWADLLGLMPPTTEC